MAQEFELIKQLEIEVKKQTGKKLNKYSLDYKRVKNLNSFTVDPGGNVVEIVLSGIRNMAALMPIFLKFQHLMGFRGPGNHARHPPVFPLQTQPLYPGAGRPQRGKNRIMELEYFRR